MTYYDNSPAIETLDHTTPPNYAEQLHSLAKDVSYLKNELDLSLINIARTEYEVLIKLSLIAEYKDEDTSTHILRIGYMAELLGILLEQSPEFCFLMRLAAPMHDVGKLGISDSVLQKKGSFTDDERQLMNQHPIIGAKILDISNNAIFQLASQISLSHHEKYNGTGYPYGLSGDDIPFAGQIVAIVDFYDALTMDRCYRKAFTDEVALNMLIEQKGLHFSPNMVDIFVKNQKMFIDLREKINASEYTYDDLISLDMIELMKTSSCEQAN